MAVSIINSKLPQHGNGNAKPGSFINNDAFEQHIAPYRPDTESSKKSTQQASQRNSKLHQDPKASNEKKDTSTTTDNIAGVGNNNDATSKAEYQKNNNSDAISGEPSETTEAPTVIAAAEVADIELLDMNIETQIPFESSVTSEEVRVPLMEVEGNEEQSLPSLDKVDNQNINVAALQSPEGMPEIQKLSTPIKDDFKDDLQSEDDLQSVEISEVNENNIIIPGPILPINLPVEVTVSPEVATSSEPIAAEGNNISLPEAADSDTSSQEKSLKPTETLNIEPHAQIQTPGSFDNAKLDTAIAAQSQTTQPEAQTPEVNPIATTNVIGSVVMSRADQKSKNATAPEAQPEEFSIIESVNVQTIESSKNADHNADHEKLPDFNQQKEVSLDDDTLEIQTPENAFESIEHGDTSMKIINSKEVIATAQSLSTEELESVANQIKTAVQNISNINGKKITINLTPESLGRIEIEVTTEAGKTGKIISIKIEVAKPETLALLEKNSQILENALKTVTSGNESSLSFNLKEGNHGGNNEQPKSGKNARIIHLDKIESKPDSDTNSITSNTNNVSSGTYLGSGTLVNMEA